ncbi:MAG: hypothetical protein ACMXYD_01640 [Candidatus Woesearchaeota archaeon]
MSPRDREKQREYWRNWYRNNPEKAKEYYRKKAKKRRKKITQWYHEYKDTLSCEHCGEEENVCLEFHHPDPEQKDLAPSQMKQLAYSIARIQEEMNKCVVLCANCHRKEHVRLEKENTPESLKMP